MAAMLAQQPFVDAATLWTRRSELADEINIDHTNSKFLGDHVLPQSLRASTDLVAGTKNAGVIAMAVPASGFRQVALQLAQHVGHDVPIVSLTKGLEHQTSLRMSQVLSEVMPNNPCAVLSGPNLAREILAGQPAASVIGCTDKQLAARLQELMSRPSFRLYTNSDVVGCEIGGVVKNIIAIAAGIAQGFGFGDNTKAALVTRGLAEMSRLGVVLGANPLTFAGLAGMGDIMATCASTHSRNTQVGVRLGQGESIHEIVNSMNMVAEGVTSSSAVVALAKRHGIEMPIAQQVALVCEGAQSAEDSLRALMSRSSKSE
ncbi:MAG: NAD(P)-dependent glycerol-3-phosphate dehydrogenase [Actinobacteria bacterium]|nr:MAG: NAD(P)-dependent glycerol-3-phosphate dehydrogenase [Actinomycetota bacterium]